MPKPGQRYRFPKLKAPRISAHSPDTTERQAFERAYQSLQGLVVGDCFGEQFFGPVVEKIQQIIEY